MSYWIREIAGWALVIAGLLTFTEVYGYCAERRPIEAAVMTVVGAFIFRGGIHLLKVAVAARVCSQVRDRLYPAPPTAPLPVGPRDLSRRTTAVPRS